MIHIKSSVNMKISTVPKIQLAFLTCYVVLIIIVFCSIFVLQNKVELKSNSQNCQDESTLNNVKGKGVPKFYSLFHKRRIRRNKVICVVKARLNIARKGDNEATESDLLQVKHPLYVRRNNTEFQVLELTPQTFSGLITRIAWLDTRPAIHDTPCLRVGIFLLQTAMKSLNITRVFKLVLKFGGNNVEFSSYTTFSMLRRNMTKKVNKLKFREFILNFPLHKALRNQTLTDLSTASVLKIKNSNLTYPLEIKVIQNKTSEQEKFFLCVNILYGKYPKLSEDYFIEWVEFYRMMGVHEIHMYNSSWQVSNRMKTILEKYENSGLIHIHSYHTPFYYTNRTYAHAIRRAEIENLFAKISSNDCFFTNLHRFQYMVSADLDEFIVPTQAQDYHSLMAAILDKHSPSPSFLCQWRYYFLFLSPTKDKHHTGKSSLVSAKFRTFEPPVRTMTSTSKGFLNTELCGFSRVHNCYNPEAHIDVTEHCTTNHYRNSKKYKSKNSTQEVDTKILRFQKILSEKLSSVKQTHGVL